MSKRILELPVLRINEQAIVKITSSTNVSLYRIGEDVALKGGFGSLTYFIDMQLKKYEVKSVIKKRRSYHPFVLGAKKKSYIVDYNLSEPTQLTFDDVKRIVIDLVTRKRWYTQGGQSKEEFVKMFKSLENMPELMANLSAYGKVQF
jgi:hypothetical protein